MPQRFSLRNLIQIIRLIRFDSIFETNYRACRDEFLRFAQDDKQTSVSC